MLSQLVGVVVTGRSVSRRIWLAKGLTNAMLATGNRDAGPDKLDDAERPCAGEKPVEARQHAAGRERQHKSRAASRSSAYIAIMNATAQTQSMVTAIRRSRCLRVLRPATF
jgi:hypothetical protein